MDGLYAGSFDPIHLGHVAIVEAAAPRFRTLWVVVVGNPEKRSGMFTLAEREALIGASTRHVPNIKTMIYAGLTVELAAELGVACLVRGAANRGREYPRPAPKEIAAELDMAAMNQAMTGIPTLFVPAHRDTAHIGARHIRQLWRTFGVDGVRDLVPPPVLMAMQSHRATNLRQ